MHLAPLLLAVLGSMPQGPTQDSHVATLEWVVPRDRTGLIRAAIPVPPLPMPAAGRTFFALKWQGDAAEPVPAQVEVSAWTPSGAPYVVEVLAQLPLEDSVPSGSRRRIEVHLGDYPLGQPFSLDPSGRELLGPQGAVLELEDGRGAAWSIPLGGIGGTRVQLDRRGPNAQGWLTRGEARGVCVDAHWIALGPTGPFELTLEMQQAVLPETQLSRATLRVPDGWVLGSALPTPRGEAPPAQSDVEVPLTTSTSSGSVRAFHRAHLSRAGEAAHSKLGPWWGSLAYCVDDGDRWSWGSPALRAWGPERWSLPDLATITRDRALQGPRRQESEGPLHATLEQQRLELLLVDQGTLSGPGSDRAPLDPDLVTLHAATVAAPIGTEVLLLQASRLSVPTGREVDPRKARGLLGSSMGLAWLARDAWARQVLLEGALLATESPWQADAELRPNEVRTAWQEQVHALEWAATARAAWGRQSPPGLQAWLDGAVNGLLEDSSPLGLAGLVAGPDPRNPRHLGCTAQDAAATLHAFQLAYRALLPRRDPRSERARKAFLLGLEHLVELTPAAGETGPARGWLALAPLSGERRFTKPERLAHAAPATLTLTETMRLLPILAEGMRISPHRDRANVQGTGITRTALLGHAISLAGCPGGRQELQAHLLETLLGPSPGSGATAAPLVALLQGRM